MFYSQRLREPALLLLLLLAAMTLTLGALLAIPGSRSAGADPLLRDGWVRVPFTADECPMIGAMIRAWARTAPDDPLLVEQLPGFLGPRVTDEELALHRAWVAWEAEQGEKWAAAGCPDDGVRGAYEKKGDPSSRQYRVLIYGSAYEWAEATGVVPAGTYGPGPFRYPWE
ncbi:MAG: hypothetical protein RMK15_02415 [Chloroflexota bacterium]|nr:hypothetical protein [Dehalococcoidia bacterium]MDW8046118.1 hypothetical protein [Chloroflexota bacterium]